MILNLMCVSPQKIEKKDRRKPLEVRDKPINLNCGKGYYGFTHMSKIIKLYTLNMCNFCLSIIS